MPPLTIYQFHAKLPLCGMSVKVVKRGEISVRGGHARAKKLPGNIPKKFMILARILNHRGDATAILPMSGELGSIAKAFQLSRRRDLVDL
jgi:hypothetical protein